jgi:hypothetical protein
MFPHLRVARPTDNLEPIAAMYREGLDLETLGHFEDHDGFDGVILGAPGCSYHLEFTSRRGHAAGTAPNQDNLLVVYLPDPDEWRSGCEKMVSAGFRQVPSCNPYWDRKGATFEDLDGYRIVLQNSKWST